MTEPSPNTEPTPTTTTTTTKDNDTNSLKVSFQKLSAQSSTTTSLDFFSSTTITVSESTSVHSKSSVDKFEEKEVDSVIVINEKSSVINAIDSNLRSKPHKGNDIKWDAVQNVVAKDGELGLGHFRLLKKLGFGDIGSVYLAELRGGLNCLFAMKVMDKGMLAGRKKLARAQTEREILGLLDHPFLPTLYSCFDTEKFSCLLMEFCSGGDLHLLRQCQPGRHFTEQAARFYASEVLLALEYLHMMGVVYRDLKPENVLVREDGHIMLSDFDLSMRCLVNPTIFKSNIKPSCTNASYCIEPSCINPSTVCVEPSCFLQPTCFKPFRTKHTKKGTDRSVLVPSGSRPELIAEPTTARSMSFVGTHEYLAPEIVRGEGHGSSVDWWTFGVFLYELLYGKTPFKGSNGNRETLFNIVGQPLKFPEGSNVGYNAKDLIKGLLAKDPQKRLGFKRGATEIKQHPFFENVNWALIRSTNPPEIPKPVDLTFFNQRIKDSNDIKVVGSESDRGNTTCTTIPSQRVIQSSLRS